VNLRTRFLLVVSTVVVAGACVLLHWILEDVKPRYREAVEESLNDTANLLACLVQNEVRENRLPPMDRLRAVFDGASSRRLQAEIYDVVKLRVDLQVYVTDGKGIVVFDSDGGRLEGEDLSTRNDVWLALRGRYGARTTRSVESDPSTSAMYVAAPIYADDGSVLGVLTVKKPVDAVLMFMRTARERVVVTAVVAMVVILLLVGVLTAWVTRPLQELTAVAKAIGQGERASLPTLGTGEIAILARTIDDMREALEGRKYVERYVQTLSHEMKAPIAAIKGAAELMDEDMPAEDRTRFLANVRNEVRRLQDIVDSLLLLASLEARRELRKVEDLDGAAIVREVASSLGPAAAAREVTVEVQAAPTPFRGEAFLVRHAVVNLLQNALDFTPPGGRVVMRVEPWNDTVTFTVEDSGAGVPDYALDKVYERFYSLERPGTGRKSSGLGLAFVREVAVLHGGRTSLVNGTRGGAVAVLTIPAQPPAEAEPSSPPPGA